MQVTETLSDGLRRAFAVVVPAATIAVKRDKRLAAVAKDMKLPGFRPGKIPPNIVRQRFGGAVMAEVLEESVNDATQQVLTDRGLRSAGQPKVELTGTIDPRSDTASDLSFTVEVELLPEITPPEMSDIELTKLVAVPSEATIDKALSEIATRQRTLIPIEEERPAATGDVLTVDFLGKVDGVPFDGGTGTGMDVEIGGSGFIPGFSEGMVGMNTGEARTIDVTFPAEYGVPALAGKPATFDITVKAIKAASVPPIDDELGKTLGFEGLDEVKALITKQVQREYDQMSRMRLKRELLDRLAERAKFPVPESMVEAEFGAIWQRIEADRKTGSLDAEDAGKDDDTLKSEYRAIAERRVRLGLLLSEIGRAANITVGADELTRAMRAEAGRYPGQEQQVIEFFRKNQQAVEGLRGPIFEEKVVDYVLGLVKLQERTVTPEELAADPATTTDNAEAEPGQVSGAAESVPAEG